MALCIWSLGTMHHRKTPSDCRKHSREYKLCVCVCVCVCTCTRAHTHTHRKGREGKGRPSLRGHAVQAHTPQGSLRLDSHPLVGRLYDRGSETTALIEIQDTRKNHPSLATTLLPKPTAQQALGQAWR